MDRLRGKTVAEDIESNEQNFLLKTTFFSPGCFESPLTEFSFRMTFLKSELFFLMFVCELFLKALVFKVCVLRCTSNHIHAFIVKVLNACPP